MGLTIAEQMALLQQAKAQAEAAEPNQAEAAALPPAVRVLPLGEDRRGALFWKLPCSAIVAGRNKEPLSRKVPLQGPGQDVRLLPFPPPVLLETRLKASRSAHSMDAVRSLSYLSA